MEKMSSWENTGSLLRLQGIIYLHLLILLKGIQKAIFRFHETKRDDPVIAARNLFGKIVNIHPFED